MAGELDGKRTEKMRAVTEAVCGLVVALCAFNVCTMKHCYLTVRKHMPRRKDDRLEDSPPILDLSVQGLREPQRRRLL